MSTVRQILVFTIFLLISSLVSAQHKPKIEIYLVEEKSAVMQTGGGYFDCNTAKLVTNPFITDNEITEYEIINDTVARDNRGKLYRLHLDTNAQSKVEKLNRNIPLCCGQRFVVTVDGTPIYGGYFWNVFSSFGCTWLAALTFPSKALRIERGIPYDYFDKNRSDPRGDVKLMEAFKVTSRLTEK
jgi:hypothetical protein